MKNLKKFLIIFSMCLLMFFSTTYTLFAATITSMNPTYKVTNANVNFRSYATTSSTAIRQLSKNTKVKVVGSVNNFYIVQLSTNEVGFIYKDYLSTGSSAPAGALTYTNIGKTNGSINTNNVNIRRGPRNKF